MCWTSSSLYMWGDISTLDLGLHLLIGYYWRGEFIKVNNDFYTDREFEKFINENLPHITDAFEAYKYEQKQQALKQLSEEEKLSPDKLEEVIGNYIFTERKPLPDHIVNMLEVKPKILERKSVVQRIR